MDQYLRMAIDEARRSLAGGIPIGAILVRDNKVIAGESRTFPRAKSFMVERGVEVSDLDDYECYNLMRDFIKQNPKLWNEDIGEGEVSK